jgi:hypothetical protein
MKTTTIFSLGIRVSIWISLASFALVSAKPRAAVSNSEELADKISHARIFSQPLLWTGATPPTADESQELFEAAGLGSSKSPLNTIGGLESFVKAHPDSSWTPSLWANLAAYYRGKGLYSRALDYWQKAWQATKDLPDANGRMVADYTVANCTHLLSSLGRVEQLELALPRFGGQALGDCVS